MAFFIIDGRGSPGTAHATRAECFEIVDGMVRDGVAEAGEFWVVEHDKHGRVVGEPFPAPSGLERAKSTAT